MKVIEILKGKKTYFLSGLALGTIGAHLLGFLDYDTTVTILTALGFGSVVTLRSAISDIRSK